MGALQNLWCASYCCCDCSPFAVATRIGLSGSETRVVQPAGIPWTVFIPWAPKGLKRMICQGVYPEIGPVPGLLRAVLENVEHP